MTAEELEKLLSEVTPGEWRVKHVHDEYGWYGSSVLAGDDERVWLENKPDPDQWDATLMAMAPALARRVIAAERLADAMRLIEMLWNVDPEAVVKIAKNEVAAYEAAK